jgi:hypothetical protein
VAVVASFPRARAVRRSRSAFIPVYWHLLSLDAPTVAVLWAWALARAAGVDASPATLAVLGIGTWLIYIADRLLDGRSPERRHELRERHFFHVRHTRTLLIASGAAGALQLLLITVMPAVERREDAWIFAVVLVYSAAVHQRLVRIHFPRELAVGIVFACACAVPAWSGSGELRGQLVLLTVAFAALCFLNCTAIHAWEHPDYSGRRSQVSLMAVCIAAAAVVLVAAMHTVEGVRVGMSVAASALLLLLLDGEHHRALKKPTSDAMLSAFALRILADAALLTPALLLWTWKL